MILSKVFTCLMDPEEGKKENHCTCEMTRVVVVGLKVERIERMVRYPVRESHVRKWECR